jgi:DNA-binding PucR family transcriptional regulator
MQAIQGKLHFYFNAHTFYIGIGGQTSSMPRLKAGYLQALAAMSMAKYQKMNTYRFDNMGFFRLLFSVNDANLLDSYVHEHLGALLDYDKAHNSNYTETLHQYLMNDGSIQAIADTMFCHRNTINYRVHSLKESFGFDLESAQVRFDLMTSFLIREYLSMDINL